MGCGTSVQADHKASAKASASGALNLHPESFVGAAAPPATVEASLVGPRSSTYDCAVSLSFLRTFAADCVEPGMTTVQVRDKIVLPCTKSLECRYVDVPGKVQPSHVGRPTYFASHAWSGWVWVGLGGAGVWVGLDGFGGGRCLGGFRWGGGGPVCGWV